MVDKEEERKEGLNWRKWHWQHMLAGLGPAGRAPLLWGGEHPSSTLQWGGCRQRCPPQSANVARSTKSSSVSASYIRCDRVNVLSAQTASFTGTTVCVKSVPASFNKTQEVFQRREVVTCFAFFWRGFFFKFWMWQVIAAEWSLCSDAFCQPRTWPCSYQGASYLLWTLNKSVNSQVSLKKTTSIY